MNSNSNNYFYYKKDFLANKILKIMSYNIIPKYEVLYGYV